MTSVVGLASNNLSFTEREFSFLSKRDSVIQNTPKNQLYWRYYDPFRLKDIQTSLYLNLDWSHNYSKNSYFGLGGIIYISRDVPKSDSLWLGYTNSALYFFHSNRVCTKRNWLAFEIDYGLIAERSFFPRNNPYLRVEEKYHGIGPYLNLEMQMLIAKWGSVSIKNSVYNSFGKSKEETFLVNNLQEVIYTENDFTSKFFYMSFYLGFNFYF